MFQVCNKRNSKSTLLVPVCIISSWRTEKFKLHTFPMRDSTPEISKLLSNNVKSLRKSRGMTQEQLAEQLGISVRHISDIERYDSFPSPILIEQIAKQFSVPSYTLFLPDEEHRAEILYYQKYANVLREEISCALERTTARMKKDQ